jgi:hypothetical protein
LGIVVAEDLAAPQYRFTDPDAFLSCDNPACDAPWVTGTGLVCWAIAGTAPTGSRFTDRLLVACDPACLAAAQRARRHGRWSAPMPVRDWLEAVRRSLDLDPHTTPIGAFAGAA